MNKKFLVGMLLILVAFGMSSCIQDQSHVNLYNTEEILNEGDSFSSSAYHIVGNTLELKKFSGTYTIKTFDFNAAIELTIDWDIKNGKMRVLWITADAEIIELNKGTHHLVITEGMTRLKIITDDASCQLSWEISYQ